jgi:hypothetical protein
MDLGHATNRAEANGVFLDGAPAPRPRPNQQSVPMTELIVNTPVFAFKPAAMNALTDRDTIMGYEFFLGRNPEAAHVIAEHRSKGFPSMMATFMTSTEFIEKIVQPLMSNKPVVRGDYRRRPSDEQLEWLSSFVEFTEDQQSTLDKARNWSEYFRALCTIGGIDLSPEVSLRDSGAPASRSIPIADAPRDEIDRIVLRLQQIRAMLNEVETSVRALSG